MSNPYDITINRDLALAIDWPEEQIEVRYGAVYVWGGMFFVNEGDAAWRLFDYRDPTVIWPIAKRFNAWPCAFDLHGLKVWGCAPSPRCVVTSCNSAEEAVARAVILLRRETKHAA